MRALKALIFLCYKYSGTTGRSGNVGRPHALHARLCVSTKTFQAHHAFPESGAVGQRVAWWGTAFMAVHAGPLQFEDAAHLGHTTTFFHRGRRSRVSPFDYTAREGALVSTCSATGALVVTGTLLRLAPLPVLVVKRLNAETERSANRRVDLLLENKHAVLDGAGRTTSGVVTYAFAGEGALRCLDGHILATSDAVANEFSAARGTTEKMAGSPPGRGL